VLTPAKELGKRMGDCLVKAYLSELTYASIERAACSKIADGRFLLVSEPGGTPESQRPSLRWLGV